MARRGKLVQRTGTVRGCIEDGWAEIEALRDEIIEWRDNLASNNMEHLPKYEEVDEAASTLESLSEPTIPDEGEVLDQEVTYTEFVPYKGRSISRANRCANACAMLGAARDALQEPGEEDEDGTWADLADELDTIIGEAEGVNFPSMF